MLNKSRFLWGDYPPKADRLLLDTSPTLYAEVLSAFPSAIVQNVQNPKKLFGSFDKNLKIVSQIFVEESLRRVEEVRVRFVFVVYKD